MPFAAGTRFGPYEILASIGAGGMGEVYKARDTRLDRVVAIKTLPSENTGDLERKRRFLQEAKAASALNHPNIVTIYDIGSEYETDYIAMEFVPGKTLDQLIPRNGMRISELLRYATQIADGLAQAHQAGIIHRDLKPSNVMVTTEGLVKILDFGVAKLTKPAAVEDGATRTMKALSGDGAIVGTTFYMSPEQAEGRPVDARSDIFSFGAMLYEMATGQRAFSGNSQVAVLSSILREEVKPAVAVRADIPSELTRVISRCLRKDPARRFQHTADLKIALEELKEESDSGKLAPVSAQLAAPRSSRIWIWAAAAAVVLAGASFAAWRIASAHTPALETVYTPIPLTSYPGSQEHPSFSPDGSQIAFDWNGPTQDNFDIYVKLIGPGTPLRLTTDPAPDVYPQWSPDGRLIAFLRVSDKFGHFNVIVIPALGGPERRVRSFASNSVPAAFSPESLCWTPDSKALIVSASEAPERPSRLVLVPLEGGEQKVLTRPDSDSYGDTRPSISSDGRQLAFLRVKPSASDAFVLSLSASMGSEGEPRLMTDKHEFVQQLAWLPGDREIMFSANDLGRRGSLYRIEAAPGAAARILPGTGSDTFHLAVSQRGNRLAYASGRADVNFWAVDLVNRTSALDAALSSSYRDTFPQFSPDGKRVAFYSPRNGRSQIWIANADGSSAAALTSMTGSTAASPRWSPDGQQIAFDSNQGGTYHIYVMNADGGEPHQVTSGQAYLANWSHDGRWIYFAANRFGKEEIWKVPVGGGDAVQVTRKGGSGATESVDGKTLFYVKDNGFGGIWKEPIEGGPETMLIPDVYRVNYGVTDKGIYFTPHNGSDGTSSVSFFNFATGVTSEIVKITKPLDLGLGVSPDGRTLLYSQADQNGSNLMLIENFH